MSTADELANKLASGWPRLEDLNAAVPELRRLAAVEQELAECKAAYESQFKELHALKASICEPVAWDVYVAEADNGYLVDSLEDPQLIDDCTNHGAVVTPLYAIKDNQP